MNNQAKLDVMNAFSQVWRAHYKRCVTWILCWKHSPILRRTLDWNVALSIAKMLRPDLRTPIVIGNGASWSFTDTNIIFYNKSTPIRLMGWRFVMQEKISYTLGICPQCFCPASACEEQCCNGHYYKWEENGESAFDYASKFRERIIFPLSFG